MRPSPAKAGATIILASALSACTTYSDTDLGEGAKEVANNAPYMVKKNSAAIVVRVSESSSYCGSGQVVLNKIVNGKIDNSQSVTVGQVATGDLKDFGRMYLHVLTFNLPAITKEVDKGDIRTSFRAIAPGSYVATYASCNMGQSRVWMGGNEGGTLFSPAAPPMLRPLAGSNHIVIGEGQIVDAGFLNIQVLQSDLRPNGRGIAVLIGSEAPANFREAIRKNLPDLYPKITYTKFAPYPGILAPVPLE